MTAYAGTKFAEHFAFVTDYVDAELTALLRVCVKTLKLAIGIWHAQTQSLYPNDPS